MFKYRFYYSEQQKHASKLFGHDSKVFVILPTGEKAEYTQMCSSLDGKCNWEDARLVYATNDEPKIRYEQGEQEKEEEEAYQKYYYDSFSDIDDLYPEMDEDIPMEYLEELQKIDEEYRRGRDFNQDT